MLIARTATETIALGISPFAGPQYRVVASRRQICIPYIELEERTDQDQSFFGVLDQFFKKVIGCTGIQKFGHNKLPVLGNVMCSLVTVVYKTDLHPWHSTASPYPSLPHAPMLNSCSE